MNTMTRRKFLALAALALPAAAGAHAVSETTALRVTKLPLNKDGNLRFVQFTDLHYKGDTRYALEVVRKINGLKPQFVVFTGDRVEDKRYAPEALDFIRQIESPVYGSPGNHDYWSHAPFARHDVAVALCAT